MNTIKQLSLFLENKPGHLQAVCRTLADGGISIRNLALADTQQFGIVRLIVADVEKAKAKLEAAGHVVNIRNVTAVRVPDTPGSIAKILDIIGSDGTFNIEYMYAFTGAHLEKEAVLIFRFNNQEGAEALLTKEGVSLLRFEELF